MIKSSTSPEYYHDVMEYYETYGQGTHGWHYGIWDENVKTIKDSIIASNRWLVKNTKLNTDSRVLDCGMGVGGFCFWVAKEFQCRVIGITNCQRNMEFAMDLARQKRLEHLCEFRLMNMEELDISEKFDLIVNQGSLCHVFDKFSYLEKIKNHLVVNGVWNAQVWTLGHKIEDRQIRLKELTESGFHLAPLETIDEIVEKIKSVNLNLKEKIDINGKIIKSARHIIAHSLIPIFLSWVHLDWLFFSWNARKRKNLQGHFKAGYAYSKGLMERSFLHYFLSVKNTP